jgi:translation initiation factor IF-3
LNYKKKEAAIRTFVRVNNRIRVSQVRCISAKGEMLGILPTSEALKMALNSGYDLVEISPDAKPPVCRIMNFGKYKYEESRREKLARRQQAAAVIKEMKFHANVEEHDYQTKLRHIHEFLQKGYRVKASLMFRGRENEHRELGFELFKRLVKECEPYGSIESPAKLLGNNLFLVMRGQPVEKKPEGEQEIEARDQKPARNGSATRLQSLERSECGQVGVAGGSEIRGQ